MKWFGPRWDSPLCNDDPEVPTPTDTPCFWCSKPILQGHRGVVLPFSGDPGDPPEVFGHLGCFAQTMGLKVPN